MRRAFSVCDQPALPDNDEDDSEYDASPSANGTHAEYARRHGNKYGPRVDGSPRFRPVRSSIAASGEGLANPMNSLNKPSPYGPGGMPGFGDNEMDGKVLPCHKVTEDGLVRITADTVSLIEWTMSWAYDHQLDELLDGKYMSKVKRYHVLDCRFDYEYAGGHIAGAINVNSMDALDELLLCEAAGVYVDGNELPVPSRSGELSDGEQVVLVFHCEFSAKRAPTL